MRDLLLIVPSRNRPSSIDRLAHALEETCRGDTQLLVCLDRDDADKYDFVEGAWYAIKDRQQLGPWTNQMARLYAGEFRYLGSIGDDHVPRTAGWDVRVCETLSGLDFGLCYGDDLLQGQDLPTACFMTSDIVQALGYMAPPSMKHMYIDNFWLELGKALGSIVYLPDVVIEHLHPSKGKSSNDDVYDAGEALVEPDRIAFDHYLKDRFQLDLAKIRGFHQPSPAGEDRALSRAPKAGHFDQRRVPVLVNCRDRVDALRQLVAWLESNGNERIVFVDNDSSYEPLLSYYEESPHQVIRLGRNFGHLAVWEARVLETIGHRGPYVVTDCDVVPEADVPNDALEYFAELLFRHGDVGKAGFGLRIDDLPPSYQFRREVIDWEGQFWEIQVEPGVFRADIDTTFALYRPTTPAGSRSALRTGPPYVARHIPWYKDSNHLSEEDLYYRDHALQGVSNWDAAELPAELREKICLRRESAPSGLDDPDVRLDKPRDGLFQPDLVTNEFLESVAVGLTHQLEGERAARRAAEAELHAVRATRSYRWMAPARGIRKMAATQVSRRRARTAG